MFNYSPSTGVSGMYEELRVGLEGTATPEHLEMMLTAHQCLNNAGVDSIDDELVAIMALHDGLNDNATLINQIQSAFGLSLTMALNEYSIQFDPATPLPVLVGVLDTVSTFEQYVVPVTLWDITTSGDDPDVVLATVVELFSDVTPDEVIEHVVSVDPRVVTRMRQVAEDRMQHEEEDLADLPEDYHKRIAAINRIQRLTSRRHPHLTVELAEAGFPMTQPLLVVMEQCLDDLDQLSPPDVGREFLGLVYYSDTPLSSVHSEARGLAEDFTDDSGERFRILHAIDELYEKLQGGSEG